MLSHGPTAPLYPINCALPKNGSATKPAEDSLDLVDSPPALRQSKLGPSQRTNPYLVLSVSFPRWKSSLVRSVLLCPSRFRIANCSVCCNPAIRYCVMLCPNAETALIHLTLESTLTLLPNSIDHDSCPPTHIDYGTGRYGSCRIERKDEKDLPRVHRFSLHSASLTRKPPLVR